MRLNRIPTCWNRDKERFDSVTGHPLKACDIIDKWRISSNYLVFWRDKYGHIISIATMGVKKILSISKDCNISSQKCEIVWCKILCWQRGHPSFQKIVTYQHPLIFAETPAPLTNGPCTRLFFSEPLVHVK